MIVARTSDEAAAWSEAVRRGGCRLAVVPTLGALHDAHRALLRFARGGADAVALSIFVNPTQFGPGEDFDRYPRDLEGDLRVARAAGVDLVFAPSIEEMYPGYPDAHTAWVDPGPIGEAWEGALRPGFFRGVATVVCKLLGVLCPDAACFGQKDGQQVVVLRHVLRSLHLPVELLCMPTVRAGDGLAHSSRNAYLSSRERADAPGLYRALCAARRRLEAGERDAGVLAAEVGHGVASARLDLDYAAVVGTADLQPVRTVEGRVLILAAARVGGTRLLDNLCVRVEGAGISDDVP